MFKQRCKCLLTGLCFIFFAAGVMAQQKPDWQMQSGSITTRWAPSVSPQKVLPEYPRPQLVRSRWSNLNGLWEYAITQKTSKAPIDYTGNILVPFPLESALSGVKKSLKPEELLWYHRTFPKPLARSGERVLLHFGAVDFEATVFVNGKELATHTGGYQHFTIDVTNALKAGDNDLTVKVYDPSDAGPNPHGKQVLNPQGIMYTPSSGIWQTVWIEVVPDVYIESLKITPDIDKQILAMQVNIGDGKATFSEGFSDKFATGSDLSGYSLNIQVLSAGKVISRSTTSVNDPISISVKNPRLWSPDDPFLYDLKLQLTNKGKVVDEVTSYFGMRKISIQKDGKGIERIFLNNKYTYNLGTLDQGFWPDGLYTAPTDEALRFDIEASKAMGFNTIRKHIKIEPDRWYYHSDKLGMLVWQDMVNPGNDSKEAHIQFEKENKINIAQLYNHPSIVTWVLFNEKWGQYDQERLTKSMKEYDPTRLVNGHSGEMLYVNDQLRSPSPNAWIEADMTDVHSYPYPRNAPYQAGKVMVLGEFGGIGVPIEGHLWNDLVAGWGYDGVVTPPMMQKQYTAMVDSLKVLEGLGLSGSIYTQPFDVESEQNGLMTYDRSIIKLPVAAIRSIHAKVWPVTNNYAVATKSFSAKVADTISKTYVAILDEYNSGRKDSAFLRKVAVIAQKNSDPATALKASGEYIQLIRNPLMENNLRFIAQFTTNTKAPGFDIMLKNIDRVNEVLGKDMAEANITRAIEAEEITPYTKKGLTPDWQVIEKSAVSKYGDLGQEIVWQTKVFYSINNQDWQNFGLTLKPWFEKYGHKRVWISPDLINSVAWAAFEHTDNKEALEAAVAMTAHGLKETEIAALLDTHANILYKLGKKDEALRWEEKALAAEPGNDEIKENFEKMKRGERTWPTIN